MNTVEALLRAFAAEFHARHPEAEACIVTCSLQSLRTPDQDLPPIEVRYSVSHHVGLTCTLGGAPTPEAALDDLAAKLAGEKLKS